RPGSKPTAGAARRRARRRSSASSMRGMATSNSRATMRTAVAPRASSTVASVLAGAAGRAREEDHAFGVAGNVVERPGDLRLAPAPAVRGGDRGPHPLVELAAELLDERLL